MNTLANIFFFAFLLIIEVTRLIQVPVVVDETRIEVVDTKEEEEIKEEEEEEEDEEEEDEGLMSASQMLQQAGMKSQLNGADYEPFKRNYS